jgi:hypothetical protein
VGSSAQFLEYDLVPLSASTQMVIHLKTPIMPNSQTTITIIYQTQDIADTTFQGLEFNFETIKDSSATIRNAGANVYVPQDMVLKGKPQMSTTYLPSALAGASQSMVASELGKRVYDYYPRSYQYNSKNLDPGESFVVSGLYGKNSYMLFFWEYLGVIIVILVILIAAKYFGVAARIKNAFTAKPGKAAPKAEHVERKPQPPPVAQHAEYAFSIERPIIMGMVTAFLYMLVSFLMQFFTMIGTFGYSNTFLIPFMMFMYILIFAMPFVALFGPALYVNKKYGWQEGLLTFIFAVVFIAVMFFLIIMASS